MTGTVLLKTGKERNHNQFFFSVRNADRTYATRHEIILSTRIVKFKRSMQKGQRNQPPKKLNKKSSRNFSGDIIRSSESPDDCWKQCVGDDNCVTAYIFEELCYLIGENPGTWPRHSDDGIYPYFMARDKRSGENKCNKIHFQTLKQWFPELIRQD